MKKRQYIIYQLAFSIALLSGCTDNDDIKTSVANADPQELLGIEAVIDGGTGSVTRAGTVTPLADYVGRSVFKGGDKVVFTEIRRTDSPIINFTYPGDGNYDGIIFEAGNEGGWSRDTQDGGPERIYWTDALSKHTFIAFSIPQVIGYDWKTYQFTQGGTKKTYYIGSLGDPTQTGESDIIDYYIDPYAKDDNNNYLYRKKENNDSVFTNPKLEDEDLLITYDTEMKAEPGGSVALVKFYHALSSVRVVVNISGFSSSSSAADNNTKVSNMRLLHQPTMYVWEQSKWGVEPCRSEDQNTINGAWGSTAPSYDQRKDIKLWIPHPEGVGTNQSKTFTFYGITTPQPEDYITTLPALGDDDYDAAHDYRKAELKFDVTYPDPLKPSQMKTYTYTASLDDVCFEAGYNTTINISMNHRNEKMTVGAEYENWQFVATPDVGELKKNSTFLQDTNHDGMNVTILGDANATIDDATWLYELNGKVYDIYGHTGNNENDAYQISTAYQLLSFAYEVKNNNLFTGKYIRLDADITLQKTSDLTTAELDEYIDGEENPLFYEAEEAIDWIGIGDADHAFNGTFLGGKRFIYRLKGSPLFYSLGPNARIEQLQVNTVYKPDGSTPAVTGGGMYANTNAGLICGCKVVGDVAFDASTAGAFVGTNTGIIWASYHIGLTKSTAASASVGGLAGSNSGTIASCYQAGAVKGSTTGGITASNSGILNNNYYNSMLLTPTFNPASGVIGKSSAEMTKQQFVTDLNNGINIWRSTDTEHGGLNHPDYHAHYYVYQPANYPKLIETFESQNQTP